MVVQDLNFCCYVHMKCFLMVREETKGAGIVEQSTVLNVSNQIGNKLFFLLL